MSIIEGENRVPTNEPLPVEAPQPSRIVKANAGKGRSSTRNGVAAALSPLPAEGVSQLKAPSNEVSSLDWKPLDVLYHAVFSEAARLIVVALLSRGEISKKEIQDLREEGKSSLNNCIALLVKNGFVVTRRDKTDTANRYSLTEQWTAFFAKHIQGTDAVVTNVSDNLGYFNYLLPLLSGQDSGFFGRCLQPLMKKPTSKQKFLDKTQGFLPQLKLQLSEAKILEWWGKQYPLFRGIIDQDEESFIHGETLSLKAEFKEWFQCVMTDVSKLQDSSGHRDDRGSTVSAGSGVRGRTGLQNDADVFSLAEIEGYELLSDLDACFAEELRSLGVDPASPTAAKPGSEEKVMMLAARYAAGLPLWHPDDCYDHGPGSIGNLVVDDEVGEEGTNESFDIS